MIKIEWGCNKIFWLELLLWHCEYFELFNIPLLHLSMDYMYHHGMLKEVMVLVIIPS